MRLLTLLLLLGLTSPALHAQIDLQLTEVVTLGGVVDIKHAGDGSQRLFLVDKGGRIRIVAGGQLLDTPFLNIESEVGISFNEQGLLSLAFAPDYAQSGVFYVYYTDNFGGSRLSRLRVTSDPDVADASSEEVLLTIPQPEVNHNGGRLEFGPDGMLYLSLGDGGGANDQFMQSQDTNTLLGSLLRLDVSQSTGVASPPDNPFVGSSDGLNQIWSYGLRNPWRISFDSATGDLYIADVGQDAIEEINVQPANSAGGENYGWPLFEGGSGGDPSLTFPVWTYDHLDGSCSVTGGEVYRGTDYPALQGIYIYGDFCSGKVWGLQQVNGQWQNQLLLDSGTVGNIQTFGQDEQGNIYMVASQNLGSRVFLLSDGPAAQGTATPIDGSLSGTYVVEGLNDQGFFVTVGSNANGTFVFIAWFTFDEQGNPRWLVGVDDIEDGATEVTLTMQEINGLPFLDFSDNLATRNEFGTMTFRSGVCGRFDADYDFGANGTGTLQLDKLTNIEGRDC
ncbi:MAG: PQQ-dependent sugar dehydrogenase [Pseudomonadota bacterium]